MINKIFGSTLGFASRIFINLVIVIILSKYLDEDGLGNILMALVWGQTYILLSEYGFQIKTFKDLSCCDNSSFFSIFHHDFRTKAILSGISLSLLPFFYFLYPGDFKVFIWIYLSILINSFFNFFLIKYRSNAKFFYESKLIFLNNFMLLTLIVIGVLLNLSLYLVALIYFISRLLSLMFLFTFDKDLVSLFNVTMRNYSFSFELRKGLSYSLITIIGVVYVNLDTLILSNFASVSDLGAYQLLLQTILGACFLTGAISSVSLNSLSIKKSFVEVWKYFVFSVLVGFFVSFLYYLLAPIIILYLFDKQAETIVQLNFLASILIFFRYSIAPVGAYFTAINKNDIRLKINFLGIVGCAAVFVFSESKDLNTAILSNIVCHLIILFCFIFYLFLNKEEFFNR